MCGEAEKHWCSSLLKLPAHGWRSSTAAGHLLCTGQARVLSCMVLWAPQHPQEWSPCTVTSKVWGTLVVAQTQNENCWPDAVCKTGVSLRHALCVKLWARNSLSECSACFVCRGSGLFPALTASWGALEPECGVAHVWAPHPNNNEIIFKISWMVSLQE